MSDIKRGNILHDIFIIGVIVEGIDGILEFIGGIALIFVKSNFIINITRKIFQHEIVQDPTDLISNYLIRISQHISPDVLLFIAIYFIIHGIIKIGLVVGLWLKKLWAYPLAGIILTLFVIYQIVRLLNTHSPILIFSILIDILILILLKSEYKRLTHSFK